MSAEKSLYKLLKDSSPVAAIVSTRIFPNRIPQNKSYPCITYMRIATVPTDQKDAVSGFDKIDFDVDCWSNSQTEAADLADKVRTALDRKKITTEGSTVDTIVFVRQHDGYDDGAMIYQKSLQFRMVIIR